MQIDDIIKTFNFIFKIESISSQYYRLQYMCYIIDFLF